MTAQPSASITVSAVCPVPPTSTMRWSRMSRSPRTMESRLSIVTSVPFLIRTEDISTVYATKRATEGTKCTKSTKKKDPFCALCAFCGFCGLLCGGLYVRGFGFLTNRKTELHLHVAINLSQCFRILTQGHFCIFTALTQPFAFVREPGATLLHRSLSHSEIEQITFTRNALAIHDVEFTLAERRRNFVLCHLYFGAIANHSIAVLNRADATDIESKRRVNTER